MVDERGATELEPLSGLLPDQPLLAVQDVALVLVQLRVALCPRLMLVGFAVSVTVGVGIRSKVPAME